MSGLPRDLRGWLPPRPRGAHKGDAGHVLVVAGSRGLMGAGRLCVSGALRAGAGLATWAVPSTEYAVAAAGGPSEAMTLPLPSAGGAFAAGGVPKVLRFVSRRGIDVAAVGPGLSAGAARFVRALLEKLSVPVVADADALNALSRPPRRRAPWVITPHPGEAARLLGASVKKVQADRAAAAKALARRFGAVAVLKGAGTVVTDGKIVVVNRTGNPGMAAGGMGDALTGVIAALIPQVKAASPAQACWRAAVLGVRAHGAAGDRAAGDVGRAGITASDLLLRVPSVLR